MDRKIQQSPQNNYVLRALLIILHNNIENTKANIKIKLLRLSNQPYPLRMNLYSIHKRHGLIPL